MIHKILDGVPFRARSISSSRQDEPSAVLRALGMLIAERVPVDLAQLYPEGRLTENESGPVTRISVGQASFGRMPLMPLTPQSENSPRPRTMVTARRRVHPWSRYHWTRKSSRLN